MEKKINYIIVDDEEQSISYLDFLVCKYKNFNHIGNFSNACSALEFMSVTNPDLIFLDLNMPGMSGIEMLSKTDPSIAVVITSLYPGFTAGSYDYNVIDYLQKPIDSERLDKSITKVLASINRLDAVERLKDIEKNSANFIYIKNNKVSTKLYFCDLEAATSNGNFVDLLRADGLKYTFRYSLKETLCMLKKFDFIQINKNTIISISKITKYNKIEVELESKNIYKISSIYLEEFLNQLNKLK